MKKFAREIMSSEVFSAPEGADLNLIEVLAEAQHIRHVPVVGKDNSVIGILSIRDILLHLSKAGVSHFVPIKTLMSRDVITATPGTELSEIAKLMREHSIGAVPIVEHGKLVGIVSERDFLKLI